jgi:ubiquinone biosynthesis protein
MAKDPDVHIPRILWETTTSQVITLERIRGTKVSDVEALDAAGIDRKALARRAAEILLKMVFEDGFFHADPHPGNIFIEGDGRIGLIDFGMVGTVDEKTQEQLVEVLQAITSGDVERLVDAFFDMGVARGGVDRALLVKDVKHLISRYYGRPLAEIQIGPLFNDAMAVMQRHHMRLPSNLFLLIKMLVMSEGIGLRLDPSFNMISVLEPYAKKMMLRQYSPWRWGKQMGRATLDMAWLGVELPKRARRIVRALERGDISVRVQPAGLDPYMGRLEKLVNRIVLGIIAAALLNGLAVLMSVYHPGGDERWLGVMFTAGMVAASALGGYLAWSIWRSK